MEKLKKSSKTTRGKSLIIIVILAVIVVSLIFYVGFHNLGGETRTLSDSNYRFTGDFTLRGFEYNTNNSEVVEIDFSYGVFSAEYENQTATNVRAGDEITLEEKSYFVVETFHNDTYVPYIASGIIYVDKDSSDTTIWIRFLRSADPSTWTGVLTGDINDCSDIVLNTSTDLSLEIIIPENYVNRTGGDLNFHLGASYYYPAGAIADQTRFLKDVTLADSNIYPGTQYSGLWLKFENASLMDGTSFLVNGYTPSYQETDDGQIYVLLDNIDAYNTTQTITKIYFDDVPDVIKIWDGLIGDEGAGRVCIIT